ncbi:MAG: SMP-30/gluconolactonase/LRE family protein [Oscillospiraceae bacterium]
MKAEQWIDVQNILAEGPVWDETQGLLYWVDITGNRLWQHSFALQKTQSRVFSQNVGMLCLTNKGNVVVALEKSLLLLRGGGQTVLLDNVEAALPRNRFNDGKPDAAGRLWLGTMHREAKPGLAALYQIGRGGSCRQVFGGVTVSNGLAFSPDNRFLYYVDTPCGFLYRFDFDLATGALENKTPLIDYRNEPGSFDGIAVDSQGSIWAAHWGGFGVSRWDPATGRKLGFVSLPVPNATCCCFAGEGLTDLIITTGTGRDAALKQQYPLQGSLFVCRTDTAGLPANRYAE